MRRDRDMFTAARSTIVATALLAATAGCNLKAEADDHARTAAKPDLQDLPAVHAVWEWEDSHDGRNAWLENYYSSLNNCKVAGWPVKELSPQEIQELGKGKVEVWNDARGAFGRETTWKMELTDLPGVDTGSCQFSLKETISEDSDDHQYSTESDYSDPNLPNAAEQDSFAKVLGFTRVGASTVKGQPCMRWRSEREEICLWSGGKRIVLDDGATHLPCPTLSSMGYIDQQMPLEGKILKGSGCNLELKSITVSRGFLKEVDHVLVDPGKWK